MKMKIPGLCLSTFGLLQQTLALPQLAKGYTDFENVRLLSRLNQPYEEPPSQKYLQQSTFSAQYDGRFANRELDIHDKHINLVALVQSYLTTMNDLGVPTWLMHETLLSWYWDRKLRPGQSRVDVMVSWKSMDFLAGFCNMTVYKHKPEGFAKHRQYLLEVSSVWNEGEDGEAGARWIDTWTGLYIDLMTQRASDTLYDLGIGREEDDDSRSRVYALQETTFEGVSARVPAAATEMLMEEYGPGALSPLQND